MTDLAIRVDHSCPEPGRRMSKLYHIGRAQQRHDTPSTELRTGLRDVLSSVFSRQSSGRSSQSSGRSSQSSVFSRQSHPGTDNSQLKTDN
jgi:hypothetical protein